MQYENKDSQFVNKLSQWIANHDEIKLKHHEWIV